MNNKLYILFYLLFVPFTIAIAQTTKTIYSWESPSGIVSEIGGNIVQHNNLSIDRINFESSGYYTINLCGKKENIKDEDNSLNSVYFTISFSDDNKFVAGDKIVITAMRNNDDGGNASICFVYDNGTVVDDTTHWDNIGQMHEMTFNGNSGNGASRLNKRDTRAKEAGTESLHTYSFGPSTNTFIVPVSADGSKSLTLTRNESECMLYITRIEVIKDISTGIIMTERDKVGKGESSTFNLAGQRVSDSSHGFIIHNGKLMCR